MSEIGATITHTASGESTLVAANGSRRAELSLMRRVGGERWSVALYGPELKYTGPIEKLTDIAWVILWVDEEITYSKLRVKLENTDE